MFRSDVRIRSFPRSVVLLVVLLASSVGLAQQPPVPIVFDTDIMGDVDDVGAVAVLHALERNGEAKILAMGVCVDNPWSPLCLDALNTYFGRPDIPLGVVHGPAHKAESRYARGIAEQFPHRLKQRGDAPDAAALYRQVLAAQPDRSVVFVSVGMLTNMRNLLKTPGDRHSPLTGAELVKQKVRAWVCMGGKFPEGREWNLIQDGPAASYVVEHWPTPVVFSGYEIGEKIMTGAGLKAASENSPVRKAYELYNGLKNRKSWDQTAVLFAVRGLDGRLKEVWDLHSNGHLKVDQTGGDAWQASSETREAYLVQKMAPEKIAAAIEKLMLTTP